MKNFRFALPLAFLVSSIGFAQSATYELEGAHSKVEFGVRHLGINTVKGEFRKFSGTIQYDPKAPEATKIDATIDVNSIDTANAQRDKHLKSPDFFDAKKFGKMTFVSTGAKSTGPGSMEINGNLTMHGVTKPVVLTVSDIGGPGLNPLDKKNHVGASVMTKINRQDFGMTWNGGGMTGIAGEAAIGNDIKIQLEIDGVEIAKK